MADNYLENKMEEHRARRGGSSSTLRPALTPRGTRPGEWVIKFTPCDVVVEMPQNPEAITLPQEAISFPREAVAIIRQLVGIGFKVFFRHPDIHQGGKLAKTLGARLIPRGMAMPRQAIHIKLEKDGIIVANNLSTTENKLSTTESNLPETESNLAEIHLPDTSEYSLQTAVWAAVYLARHAADAR